MKIIAIAMPLDEYEVLVEAILSGALRDRLQQLETLAEVGKNVAYENDLRHLQQAALTIVRANQP